MSDLALKKEVPEIIDLELELKREQKFLRDYPKFSTGELSLDDLDVLTINYRFKNHNEAKQWFIRKIKSEN
jgi:hypothetical protein